MSLFKDGLNLLELYLLALAKLLNDLLYFVSPVDQINFALHILEQRHLDLENTALSQQTPVVVLVPLVVAFLLLFVQGLHFKFPPVDVRDFRRKL